MGLQRSKEGRGVRGQRVGLGEESNVWERASSFKPRRRAWKKTSLASYLERGRSPHTLESLGYNARVRGFGFKRLGEGVLCQTNAPGLEEDVRGPRVEDCTEEAKNGDEGGVKRLGEGFGGKVCESRVQGLGEGYSSTSPRGARVQTFGLELNVCERATRREQHVVREEG